jgi:3D (Asp-Asp-Asp) domain-containing protein
LEKEAAFAWKQQHFTEEAMTVIVTAYCPCSICCGKSDGITKSGTIAKEQHTIAVDPDVIPLGSEVYLEGLGTFVAEDTGGAIKGNRIDIFMQDHKQALQFGIQKTNAYLLNEKI